MKKQMLFKTKGMNQDLSVSAFNPEFSFENRNLRLSTNEGNTLMSWVNEKGTAPIKKNSERDENITLEGIPVGSAVLNHKLVVFTTKNQSSAKVSFGNNDYIFVLEYTDRLNTKMSKTVLYNGNLNFSTKSPLETLVSYEAEHVQKVYWTDGRNQPRMINIVSSNIKEGVDTQFDFIPALQMTENVTTTHIQAGGGLFAPGVIQYCFTYMNKYGQQSNIVYISPLFYIAHSDRGASPEEKVTSSFKLEIENPDTNFEYIRIYSIQRTSLDAEAIVKILDDVPTSNGNIDYTDSGTTGASIDPYELLYVGGKDITALTMCNKDTTLFLGNISVNNNRIDSIQKYYDDRRDVDDSDPMGISFEYDDSDESRKTMTLKTSEGFYCHTNELSESQRKISTFKGGEAYRFGFQLQRATGEWTDPIFMNDVQNDKYPKANLNTDVVNLSYAKATIDLDTIGIDTSEYKRIRPVIVYPNIGDRHILCQGVLNPTMFNMMDRYNNAPYAQASWFFRPYSKQAETMGVIIDLGGKITFTKTALSTLDMDNLDLSIDSYFIDKNAISTTYVLIADIPDDDTLNTIIERRSLMYFEEVWRTGTSSPNGSSHYQGYRKSPSFTGVISLVDSENPRRYAFLKSSPFPEAYPLTEKTEPSSQGNWNTTWKGHAEYTEGITVVSNNNVSFNLYSGISHTEKQYLYYSEPEDSAPDSYKFKFWGGDYYYVVTFNTVKASESPVIVDNSSGDVVRFLHYQTLLCDNKLSGDNVVDMAKQVEIQGSYCQFESVFKQPQEATNNHIGGKRGEYNYPSSYSQFFVDQSIITLNSPDIEFDTEVQSYSTENLKLRIIGAIPITGSASKHVITAGSSMLETYHNYSEDGGNSTTFGSGETNYNVLHNNKDVFAARRLVADYLWNDTVVYSKADAEDKVKTEGIYTWLVHPWNRAGSLNNDWRKEEDASSVLKTKKESTLLYSLTSEYFPSQKVEYSKIGSQILLTENSEVMMARLPKQRTSSKSINYYPNVDKALINSNGYFARAQTVVYDGFETSEEKDENGLYTHQKVGEMERLTTPVPMKYKSTSHAVIDLISTTKSSSGDDLIPILPYELSSTVGYFENDNNGGKTQWGEEKVYFDQKSIDLSSLTSRSYDFLWMGELYKDPINQFGGKTKDALLTNIWHIGGESVDISRNSSSVTLYWTDGDTFFQRYDNLKTYPYTLEDKNQLVEILSFMCETHVNIDGRYDRNRGLIDNTDMYPQKNFNVINPVYSQKNNFFTSRKVDLEEDEELKYPNQITWSKSKSSGADVDLWANVTLASTMELDGDKGNITSLNRLNDQLICFQDTGISQILYNENVQIASTSGVPIEIANSGKVQGKRYLSNTVGCSNKWSVVNTPNGIYFMDSNDKSIYLFNGQLSNLSVQGGFNTWCKRNIPVGNLPWNPLFPTDIYGKSAFVGYYDKQNQDVLFINNGEALAFSEKLGTFTSFYDYGYAPYFCNLDDEGIWINHNSEYTSLWEHQAGNYCQFFGENKPFSMTLVGNPEPQIDKIFTNLEFRASVEGEGYNVEPFEPFTPFDSLESWNEYQHGIANMTYSNHGTKHHTLDNNADLKRKFRIWRCDIPRDNADLDTDYDLGVSRMKKHPNDRMRNPWLYIKLMKNAEYPKSSLKRTEIHDIVMTYFD